MRDDLPAGPVIRLELSYDGSAFHGWQIQPNAPTVQGALEAALERMAGRRVQVFGASRTDAGVHAHGQVVSWPWPDAPGALSPHVLHRGLTALLPESIAVLRLERITAPAQDGGPFHARFCARGKRYRYAFWPWRVPDVRLRRYTWELRGAPDADGWQAAINAAQVMIGEHDFAGFRAADCDARTTTRSLSRLHLSLPLVPGEPLVFEVEGSAFLKNMVRILAGTLFDVARGARPLDIFARVLASGDRKLAGQTAPASGLTLDTLFYPDHPWTQPRWSLPPR